MKPSPFRYAAPSTVAEALQALAAEGGEAKALAGGQSLVPLMNLRLAAPAVLVDLNRVHDLAGVREEDGWLVIGAMTRHHDVSTSGLVAARCPMVAHAASLIGYPAIRFRGTIGGSLAHADPVAEMPCVALTLDAELVCRGPAGARTVAAGDFFVSYFTTALAPDEVVTEVRFPIRAGHGWSFQEFARKRGDFAIVAVAVDLGFDGDVIREARIGLAGVDERPVRAAAAEAALAGTTAGPDAFDRAADEAAAEIRPHTDVVADEAFRRHLARTLTRQALAEAISRRTA